MLNKILQSIKMHKVLVGLLVIVMVGGGYYIYKKNTGGAGVNMYAFTKVKKDTLIVSISGTGQVSVSNQVDIKPKVSGDIVAVGVKNGQEVKTGDLIAQLDARDALKSVRDAEANLESAKLSLEKLRQPADNLSILQAENSLTTARDNLTKLKLSQEISYQQALENKKKAEDNLKKAYEDGFSAVSSVFLNLPGVITGLDDMFFNVGDFERGQTNLDWYLNQVDVYNQDKASQYRSDVSFGFNNARTVYLKNFDDYKITSRTSGTSVIELLISETYDTVRLIADTIKTSNNYVDFVQDNMAKHNLNVPSLMVSHQTSLDSYISITNSNLSNLLSIQTTIRTSKENILNSDRDIQEMNQNQPIELSAAEQLIEEREGSFAKLTAGADALDIKSYELSLKQRQNSLFDAREKLTDYFIRAPFDGVIVVSDIKKGDVASSGTILATLITKQKIAEISLNEVDVAKVQVGQKVTLTFDAVSDLTITGLVAEVDALGTVSQGVVTYKVKIAFDTQDDRIKSGMSVAASVILEAKPDVVVVPNSAIKTQGVSSYVEMPGPLDLSSAQVSTNGILLNDALVRRTVEIGLSNDEFTEILSGLNENDLVLTRTILPSAQTAQSQSTTGGLRIPGLTTGTGGTSRTGGGFTR